MVRISVLCLAFLAVCAAVPSLAQTPAANTITCSSVTACKKATIPVFTTTGGAAKVDSSIVSQSGTTINVAGSLNATTNYEIGALLSPSALSPTPTLSWDLLGTKPKPIGSFTTSEAIPNDPMTAGAGPNFIAQGRTGNLYSMSWQGGSDGRFKVTPSGKLTVLAN